MPRPRIAVRRLRWLLFVVVAAALAAVNGRLETDPHNEGLKAPGTEEARQLAHVRAMFGGENALVLAFVSLSREPVAHDELESLTKIGEQLRGLPHVRTVAPVVKAEPDVAVLVVDLDGQSDGRQVVDAATAACPPSLQPCAAGLPLAEAAVARGVAADRRRLLPLISLGLFGVAFLAYRSLRHATAAMLPAATAIIGTGALRQILGHRLDPIGVLLEPVLLTVGVATAIHFVAAFRRERSAGHGAVASVCRARADLQTPMLAATLTTMVGFWSLGLHPIPAVAQFGAYAALGTGIAHAAAMWLLPAFLRDFPGSAPAPLAAERRRFLHGYTAWLMRRRGVLLVSTAAVGAAFAYGWLDLRVDNDPLAVLPAQDPYAVAHAEACALLGGVESFGLLVDHDSPAQAPDRLLPFAASFASESPVAGLAGPVRRGRDGSTLVPFRLQPSGSSARNELFARIETRAASLGLDGVHAVGLPVQIARDSERLVYGQLVGMAVAMAGLGLGLWVFLRSWRLALIGLVPNALPCIVLYGGLAWLGRPLTVANAMIGCAMLGLVVDNTVHVLHGCRHARGSAGQRVAEALARVVRPMLTSSGVLAVGFGLGLFGTMETTHEFALLAAVTIGLALVGDALLLPVLLMTRLGRRAAMPQRFMRRRKPGFVAVEALS